MADERISEFSGTVDGTVRGRALRGAATMKVGERGLAIVLDQGELRLPYGRLEGWVVDAGGVSLRISGGDAVLFVSERGPRALGDTLAAHACVLPELTRGLRALGSSRSHADEAQAALFAPLLAGRRRAARMRDPGGRLRALDAELLAREIASAVETLAGARVRQAGAERRALVAALEDALEPVHAALRGLAAAATGMTDAPDERRLAAWRVWTESAKAAFAAADACWPAVHDALAGAAQPGARWLRWGAGNR